MDARGSRYFPVALEIGPELIFRPGTHLSLWKSVLNSSKSVLNSSFGPELISRRMGTCLRLRTVLRRRAECVAIWIGCPRVSLLSPEGLVTVGRCPLDDARESRYCWIPGGLVIFSWLWKSGSENHELIFLGSGNHELIFWWMGTCRRLRTVLRRRVRSCIKCRSVLPLRMQSCALTPNAIMLSLRMQLCRSVLSLCALTQVCAFTLCTHTLTLCTLTLCTHTVCALTLCTHTPHAIMRTNTPRVCALTNRVQVTHTSHSSPDSS